MFRRIAILIIASACLAGCTMAPSFGRPESPVSATWPTGPSYKDATGKPADKMVADIPWQEFFNGAQTELVHLYDLDFKGCISCFACKKIGGKSYGRCAVSDGLTPILKKASEADVLILGTPVYFSAETGEMRSFLERLLFPFSTYTPDYASIFPGKLQVGLVYTMGIAEKDLSTYNYDKIFAALQGSLSRIFGNCDLLLCTDTYQFSDYSKYVSTAWDAEAKKKRREEVFPQDCKRAFDLGAKLTAAASGS